MLEGTILSIILALICIPVVNTFSKWKKELREYENNETNRQ